MINPLGDADPPDIGEDISPAEAHDLWEQETNLGAPQLRAVRDNARNDRYLEVSSSGREESDGPIPGGPLDDAIHLATTPASEWGPDERAEAEEAINWASRHRPQFDPEEGEDLTPGDGTKTTKADVAGWRWGFDWRLDDDLP